MATGSGQIEMNTTESLYDVQPSMNDRNQEELDWNIICDILNRRNFFNIIPLEQEKLYQLFTDKKGTVNVYYIKYVTVAQRFSNGTNIFMRYVLFVYYK